MGGREEKERVGRRIMYYEDDMGKVYYEVHGEKGKINIISK